MIEDLFANSLIQYFDSTFFIQILLVIFSGALIGFERQRRDKPVGMRTSMLICLGTMLFIRAGLVVMDSETGMMGDPTRVLGQVVTGIGFLGAGSIINREGLVVGLTTAATIWVQAAIGALIGFGHFMDAFIFTLFTVLILYGVTSLELRFKKFFRRKRTIKKLNSKITHS